MASEDIAQDTRLAKALREEYYRMVPGPAIATVFAYVALGYFLWVTLDSLGAFILCVSLTSIAFFASGHLQLSKRQLIKVRWQWIGFYLNSIAVGLSFGLVAMFYLPLLGLEETLVIVLLNAGLLLLANRTFACAPKVYQAMLVAVIIPELIPFISMSNDLIYAMLAFLTAVFAAVMIFINWQDHKTRVRFYQTNFDLADAKEEIEKEKHKSEELLLNILPVTVANELKQNGASKPIRFKSASVVFTDFVGFTRIAEKFSPEEVVDELDKCFSYFDQVTQKYNLEKLKTIGDAFMCAGGIPEVNTTHALDCCLAALEIQAFMAQMKTLKEEAGFEYWELRLGINTGPLVAGVVGTKKFAYDVWGDTVNTASRMESAGTNGRINISQSTHDEVKDLLDCEYRGKVAAKNKGEIPMYFLNGIKPNFSVGGFGKVPNREFKGLYAKLRRG